MSTQVFSVVEPYDDRPKGRSESWPTYLRRSSAPEATKFRTILDEWTERYPATHCAELLKRLRSCDEEFQSAFFELYLHTLFENLGYGVELHPDPENGTEKRPDFLLRGPAGDEAFVEARVVVGLSEEGRKAEGRKNRAIDAINTLEAQEFFLYLEDETGSPSTSVRDAKLRRDLLSWLESLDVEHCVAQLESGGGLEVLPVRLWEDQGWQLRIKAIPKGKLDLCSSSDSRLLGSQKYSFGPASLGEAVRSGLKKKALKYGELGRPYVVAVDVMSPFCDDLAIQEALFGSKTCQLVCEADGGERLVTVAPHNGLFGNLTTPKDTRVSAVLVVVNVDLGNFASPRKGAGLYHHPHAAFPVKGLLNRLPQVTLGAAGIQLIPGISIPDILGFQSDWLERDP